MLIERSNLERLMESAQLEAIVATDPPTVAALAGYRSWLDGQFRQFMVRPCDSGELIRSYAVFVPGDLPVALILDPLFVRDAASAGADCWTYGDPARAALAGASAHFRPTPEEAISSVLHERGVAAGRIGVEVEGMPSGWRDVLATHCPGAILRDCTVLLRVARAVKSDTHIEQLRSVTRASNRALAAALGLARPGARLGELTDAYAAAAGAEGAAIEHFALSHGGRGIAADRNLRLTADMVSYLDHGCRTPLAASDAGTTLHLRELSRVEEDAFSALQGALAEAAGLLASHATSSAVYGAMEESLAAFPDAIPQGHGLGVEIREYPLLLPRTEDRLLDECIDVSADLELETGMVVNLEASLFGLGDASVHIEETYIVTKDGAEQLAPVEEISCLVAG
jgi:Xaa-Pro dipeptidase